MSKKSRNYGFYSIYISLKDLTIFVEVVATCYQPKIGVPQLPKKHSQHSLTNRIADITCYNHVSVNAIISKTCLWKRIRLISIVWKHNLSFLFIVYELADSQSGYQMNITLFHDRQALARCLYKILF